MLLPVYSGIAAGSASSSKDLVSSWTTKMEALQPLAIGVAHTSKWIAEVATNGADTRI